AEPTEEQTQAATKDLIKEVVRPLSTNPKLRQMIIDVKQQHEQIIDEITKDELTFAGSGDEALKKAQTLVQSWEAYIAEHKSELDALQFFYSQPHRRRLSFDEIKALAEAIEAPPRRWTPERLWKAYEQLDKSKVRGAKGKRLLTDMVSLIKFALHREDELVPYVDQVAER